MRFDIKPKPNLGDKKRKIKFDLRLYNLNQVSKNQLSSFFTKIGIKLYQSVYTQAQYLQLGKF